VIALGDQIDAWFSSETVAGPELVVSYQALDEDVADLAQPGTLIVVDPYNADRFANRYPLVAVADDSNASTIEAIREEFAFKSVVAIGGCTALDVGRACAESGPTTCIPTILSNSCISSDTSVIRRQSGYSCEHTTRPIRTILNMPTLVHNHRDRQKNWSASGLGDLLSTLGAIAERDLPNRADLSVFEQGAPLSLAALDWIDSIEYPLDDNGLVMLGKLLHIFSINGHATAPVGSEHSLYYTMRERHSLSRMVATHGKIVAGASLWPLHVWCAQAGDFELLSKVEIVFRKVGLPISQPDFAQLGVSASFLRDAIASTDSTFYYEQSSQKGDDWFLTLDQR
jgi:glycerol dehydrogenase-like iron-containing ADH family enzyme